MSDVSARIAVSCPSCSPDAETVHEVLKEGGQATVRCTECGHVHKTRIERQETVETDVIVSQSGESFSATADAPPDEEIAVGEEFVLETDEAIMVVRITSLELPGGGRTEQATVSDVDTIWTRAVDNITVNVTVHPKDGRREETRSIEISVPGDEEFRVGETREFGKEEFTIEGIYIREDATGYYHNKLDHDNDMAIAKDVKRLYARDEGSTAWSAW